MSKKISQLNEVTTVADSDILPVVDSGATKKVTKSNLLKEVNAEVDTKADQTALDAHTSSTANPHSVTKAQVGLSNVTNDAQVKVTDIGVTVPNLTSGKIPISQLPAIAISDTFVVASQAAMLALTAEIGDVAIRTDLSKTYILKGSDPTVLANWELFLTSPPAWGTVTGTLSSQTDLQNALNTKQYKNFITVGSSNADYITDGTADNVEIQAAIDYVNSIGGGFVKLQAGIFNTTATIHLKSNVTLSGSGLGNTIIKGSSTSYTMINTVRTGTTKTLYNYIGLCDISFLSQKDAIIEINNTNVVNIERIEVNYNVITPVSECFNLQYCQNIFINKNYLHNITGNGIQINACDYFEVTNNRINGVVSTDTDGIDIDTDFMLTKTVISRFGTVTGNIINNCVNGIRVENGQNFVISGNTIDGSSDSGIYLNTSDGLGLYYVTISDNNISNATYDGISIVGDLMKEIKIDGNNINDSGHVGGSNIRAGINVNSPNVQVTNNNLVNCGGNDANGGAIVLYKKSPVLVANNYIQDSTFGIRVWNGSASEVYTGVTILNNKMNNNTTNYVDGINLTGVLIVSNNDTGIGIGNINPSVKLQVSGNIHSNALGTVPAGSAGIKILAYANDTHIGIDRPNSAQYGEFIFATNGTRDWTIGTRASDSGLHFYGQTLAATALYLKIDGKVGIGTTSPTSNLHVAGSFGLPYVAKTAAYTLTASDYTVNVTTGTNTQTLPTAVGIAGRMYVIKNSGTGVVTVATTSSQTIDGATTYSLSTQYQSITVQSNGANWVIVNKI